ncbi:hypothetical protein T484DRAFT_1879548, partial [Baffinella frigidus]
MGNDAKSFPIASAKGRNGERLREDRHHEARPAGLMAGILSHINSVPTPSKASAPDVPLDWKIIANLCEERISAAEGSLSSEDVRRAWHYCARGSSEQVAGKNLTPSQIGDRLQQAVAEAAVATRLEFLCAHRRRMGRVSEEEGAEAAGALPTSQSAAGRDAGGAVPRLNSGAHRQHIFQAA